MNNSSSHCIVLPIITGEHLIDGKPECLVQPDTVECTTLDCVLTTVIEKDMHWIDTIYVNGVIKIENEMFIQHETSPVKRNICIACLESCKINSYLAISALTFRSSFVLKFEGISFQNCTFFINNIHLVLNNVYFIDSILTDHEPGRLDLGQVRVHLSHIKFESQNGTTTSGLIFQKLFTASLFVRTSELTKVVIVLSIPNLFLDCNEMLCFECHIDLKNTMFSFIVFENMYFGQSTYSQLDFSVVKITGHKMNAEFTNCMVENTTGLEIMANDYGLFDSWINVRVQNCSFKKCVKSGKGGALSVNYFPSHTSFTNNDNFVKIINSTFSENKAVRFGQSICQGGAIQVSSQATGGSCSVLSVDIEGSNFINNKATDGGGALFTS